MGKESGWEFNNGGIALMWRGGCIIRSAFLGKIKEAFDRDPDLTNLLLDPYFSNEIKKAQDGWRRVCAGAVTNGIPIPEMASALAYYDGYRCEPPPRQPPPGPAATSSGAHTYERIDRPRGQFFPHQLDRPRRDDLVDVLQRST